MYTVRLLSPGKTTDRRAVLEDAITHVMGMARLGLVPQEAITYVLTAARYQPFPTGTWTVNPTSFEQRVMEIMQRANDTRPAGVAAYETDEVRAALIERGYRPGTLPIVPPTRQVPVVVQDKTVIIPNPTIYPTSPERREPGPVILPVVVPRSPVFPEIPMVTAPKKSNTFLWIAGLLALYVLGKAEGTPHRRSVRSRRKKPVSGQSTLHGIGGATANCALWQEVESAKTGALLWRCLKNAPACAPGFPCVSAQRLPVKKKNQLRVCVESKKVKPTTSMFKVARITRCARFTRVCPDGACIDKPFDKPSPSPGHGVKVNSIIRDVAKSMAEERNELEETAGKALGREIAERGGIRSYKKGAEREEYRAIPIFMRKKTGLPLDEMASEMGYDSAEDLVTEIKRQYPGTTKKKRLYTASDFMQEAEGVVWRDIDAGMVSGLGQDLFPGLRREMVLEAEDLATSDDPLEIHLQRKGWNLKRVSALQESIAEKAVPDMFTDKTTPLTEDEVELQKDIDEFFAKSRVCRESVAARHGNPAQEPLYSEKVDTAKNRWKRNRLSTLNHQLTVLMSSGKYATNKREMAKVKKLEAEISKLEKAGPLSAVQLELFKRSEPEEVKQFWFFIPARHRLAQHVTVAEKKQNEDFYLKAETEGSGKLYSVPGKNRFETAQRLREILDKAREYKSKWGGSRNPHQPAYYAFTRQMGYRVVPYTEAQATAEMARMKAERLGAVQREMFEPEQAELKMAERLPKGNHHWFFLPAGHRRPRYITVAEKTRNQDFYHMAEREGKGKLYAVDNQNLIAEAAALLDSELKKEKEFSTRWPGRRNPYEPMYLETSGREGFRMVLPNTQRMADERGRELGRVVHVDPMAGLLSTLQTISAAARLIG